MVRGVRGVSAARWLGRALLALTLAAPGCRGSREERAAAAGEAPAATGMIVELTPRPERQDLIVEVRVGGPPAAAVRELHVTRAWADTRGAEAIAAIDLRDERGEIPLEPARDGARERIYPLERPPSGEFVLRFTARPTGSGLGLQIGADRMSAVGHGFLLLPRIESPVSTQLRWRLEALGPAAQAASSFGEGDVTLTATSEALARAIYAAGAIASARAGEQRLYALGAPGLAPREILGWAGRARTVAGARLQRGAAAEAEPLAIFLVGEPGRGRDHDGTFFPGSPSSLGLWFDGSRSFDPGLRIALAHELTHRYLGGDLSVQGEDGQPAAWFAEGFTVHYARRLLFDAGMIGAADLAADINRIEDEASRPGAAEREPYRRGSRYAALLDHRLRRASSTGGKGGARSLDDLLAALRARGGGALSEAEFRAAVVELLGEEAGAEFDRLMVRREAEVDLPPSAFGPCLRRYREQRREFDLGFDAASLAAGMDVIRGVVKGSAASRAGLHDGLLVLQVRRLPKPEDEPEAEVDLTVTDRRGAKRIRYRPSALHGVYRWKARPCAGG